MKGLLTGLAILAGVFSVCAGNNQVWVYLNNGNIVKGEVTKTATHITIVTEKGETLTYPMVEVNRISKNKPSEPSVSRDRAIEDMNDNDTGFWFSTQLNGSYALFLSERCTPWSELNAIGGYRFSQYLKVGVGFGARYYIDNSRLRSSGIKWSFPIFATVRGNIIPDEYRSVVPYYSFDLGGVIRDGFMWRPTFGLRIGQSRSAFLVGITYTGQTLRYETGKNRYVSGLGLTIGYEF